jgi:hypothetical protein
MVPQFAYHIGHISLETLAVHDHGRQPSVTFLLYDIMDSVSALDNPCSRRNSVLQRRKQREDHNQSSEVFVLESHADDLLYSIL